MRAGNTALGGEEEERRAGEAQEEVRVSNGEQRGYPAEAVRLRRRQK